MPLQSTWHSKSSTNARSSFLRYYFLLPRKGFLLRVRRKDGSATSLCVILDLSWALNLGESLVGNKLTFKLIQAGEVGRKNTYYQNAGATHRTWAGVQAGLRKIEIGCARKSQVLLLSAFVLTPRLIWLSFVATSQSTAQTMAVSTPRNSHAEPRAHVP